MKTGTKIGLAFVAGLGLGAVISAIVTKRIITTAQEIIESEEDIEEVIGTAMDEKEIVEEPQPEEVIFTQTSEYNEMLHNLGYTGKLTSIDKWEENDNMYDLNDSDDDEYEEDYAPGLNKYNSEPAPESPLGIDWSLPVDYSNVDPSKLRPPYQITADEYMEFVVAGGEWESDDYTLYADGYFTDAYGLPVDALDAPGMFGMNFPDYFEEGETQVYIRNEKLRMDFSLVFDEDNFADIASPRLKRLAGI